MEHYHKSINSRRVREKDTQRTFLRVTKMKAQGLYFFYLKKVKPSKVLMTDREEKTHSSEVVGNI